MKSNSKGGLVYSTQLGRTCSECRHALAECVCKAKAAPAGDGVVRVSRQTKGRGGFLSAVAACEDSATSPDLSLSAIAF
jgi:hypothetical protein